MEKAKQRGLPPPLHKRLDAAALEMERSAEAIAQSTNELEGGEDVEALRVAERGTRAIAALLSEAAATAALWSDFADTGDVGDVVTARCVISHEAVENAENPMGVINDALDNMRTKLLEAFSVSEVAGERKVNLNLVGELTRAKDFDSRSERDWRALHRWMWEHSHVRGSLKEMAQGLLASLFVSRMAPEKNSCIVVRTINRQHAPGLVDSIAELMRDVDGWEGSIVIEAQRGEVIRKLGRDVCRAAGLTS